MISTVIELMERGWAPDATVRLGIRRLCSKRLREFAEDSQDIAGAATALYADDLRKSPLAVHTQDANRQHYELPPGFFEKVLGPRMKYSSAFWPEDCESLEAAEIASLEETCSHARLTDGQKILELGCGWGSLTLFMAERYPNSRIIALSNSAPQRRYIEDCSGRRNLSNIRVLTRNILDANGLESEFGRFDRVVSVEMLEHLRNYEILFERIARWLDPSGKLFIHIFTHRAHAYPFEAEGEDNWMGKYFFTGGQMPSHDLLKHFQKDLRLEQNWKWNGLHYAKTADAWLANMDRNKRTILPIFTETYGEKEAGRWFQRWRIFFMACSELFGYAEGTEWGVSHYRFSIRRGPEEAI